MRILWICFGTCILIVDIHFLAVCVSPFQFLPFSQLYYKTVAFGVRVCVCFVSFLQHFFLFLFGLTYRLQFAVEFLSCAFYLVFWPLGICSFAHCHTATQPLCQCSARPYFSSSHVSKHCAIIYYWINWKVFLCTGMEQHERLVTIDAEDYVWRISTI